MENILRSFEMLGLSGAALSTLISLLDLQHYPKGHLLVREGKIEKTVYFLEEGIARVFFQKDGSEVTFCFCQEGDALLSLNSYFGNKPGYESIELLENAAVYKISQDVLQQLYETDITLANWGRKFAENEFIKADERFMAQQFKTASERYADFLACFPNIARRVQLGHIASYLGISQVSLSRIRAEMK
jgi:CRP-like cAMP-binding protein